MANRKARWIALYSEIARLPSCQPGITVLADHVCNVSDRLLDVLARSLAWIRGVLRSM